MNYSPDARRGHLKPEAVKVFRRAPEEQGLQGSKPCHFTVNDAMSFQLGQTGFGALMDHLLKKLEGSRPVGLDRRFKVTWSASRAETLRRLARDEQAVRDPVEKDLAPALLMCAEGNFDEAEHVIVRLLRENVERMTRYPEAYFCLVQALFMVQRFDLVSALMRDRHSFSGELVISAAERGENAACVLWTIETPNRHQFVFDASALQDDRAPHRIFMLTSVFPMFAHYAAQERVETGSVLLNQFDIGVRPGLAYCDNRPSYFLVPDLLFVSSAGYQYARQVFKERRISWQDRKPIAFWRGSTTGPKAGPRDWQSLQRIKLCEIARRHEGTGLIDAGISAVVAFADPAVEDEIRAAGLMKGFVPWQEWGNYKYHIDIDGNSCPYSNLFQRLLTGSPVLKVQSSRCLIQWYYDHLIPWENHVPIAPDMSDLMEKIRWLDRHESVAVRIGENGRRLAEQLSYEREIERSVPVISAAFRYFRGQTEDATPFGRPIRGDAQPTFQP